MVNSAQPDAGARPPPFTLSIITSNAVVYALAERADTLPLFLLYLYMYSVWCAFNPYGNFSTGRWGCTARPPLFTLSTITSKAVLYAPAEMADTPLPFLLYLFLFCVFSIYLPTCRSRGGRRQRCSRNPASARPPHLRTGGQRSRGQPEQSPCGNSLAFHCFFSGPETKRNILSIEAGVFSLPDILNSLHLLLLFTFCHVCLPVKETAEIETGMAEKFSWDQANKN